MSAPYLVSAVVPGKYQATATTTGPQGPPGPPGPPGSGGGGGGSGGFAYQGLWQADTDYLLNDVVVAGDRTWLALLDVPASASFQTSYFQELGALHGREGSRPGWDTIPPPEILRVGDPESADDAVSYGVHMADINDLAMKVPPPYGSAGQVLAKASNAAWDTTWVDNDATVKTTADWNAATAPGFYRETAGGASANGPEGPTSGILLYGYVVDSGSPASVIQHVTVTRGGGNPYPKTYMRQIQSSVRGPWVMIRRAADYEMTRFAGAADWNSLTGNGYYLVDAGGAHAPLGSTTSSFLAIAHGDETGNQAHQIAVGATPGNAMANRSFERVLVNTTWGAWRETGLQPGVVTFPTGSEPSLAGVPNGTLWVEYTP